MFEWVLNTPLKPFSQIQTWLKKKVTGKHCKEKDKSHTHTLKNIKKTKNPNQNMKLKRRSLRKKENIRCTKYNFILIFRLIDYLFSLLHNV